MKKKTYIFVLTFILFCSICSYVLASSFNVNLEIDSKTEDEIVLILKVSDVNFDNIISTIEGNIEYDKNVFEELTIENLNDWSIVFNSEENAEGKFIGFKISDEPIIQEELCKVTLKLKQDVQNSSTQVVVKNVKSADGDNLVATDDKTIDIDIKDSSIASAEEEKNITSNKSVLKYILIIIILLLLITMLTSTSYLLQKHNLEKKYKKYNKK